MRHLAIVAISLACALPADGMRGRVRRPNRHVAVVGSAEAVPDTAHSLQRDGNQVTGFVISNTGWKVQFLMATTGTERFPSRFESRFSTFTYTGELSGDTIKDKSGSLAIP